jgi:flagellar hook-associated protein FlgK
MAPWEAKYDTLLPRYNVRIVVDTSYTVYTSGFDYRRSLAERKLNNGLLHGRGVKSNQRDLSKKEVVGNKTFSDAYIDQVNTVGNAAQQAKITQQALTVVNDQAKQARDKVSGVNLDDEAADLIRFQQAYQAAAKSLQVSGQLFDSIVQIR